MAKSGYRTLRLGVAKICSRRSSEAFTKSSVLAVVLILRLRVATYNMSSWRSNHWDKDTSLQFVMNDRISNVASVFSWIFESLLR